MAGTVSVPFDLKLICSPADAYIMPPADLGAGVTTPAPCASSTNLFIPFLISVNTWLSKLNCTP